MIHQNDSISHKSKVGNGAVVMSGAVINGWVEVGSHCIINSNSTVEHDNKIGDFVTVAPGVTTGSTATIGYYFIRNFDLGLFIQLKFRS